jgi:polysaccharide export outer membrane protein
MRKPHFLPSLVFISLLAVLFFSSPIFAANGGKYLMGSGDLIRIQVFDEDDLTIETRVGDSGRVAYPFLGEIQVSGLTAIQLQNSITKKLKGPYLVNPVVTVSILEYRPFFVNGKVEKPGGFPFQPGMTVRNAISLAGGFQERADKDKIYIVSGGNPGAKPKHATLSDLVMPGDTVTVERSFF